MTGSAQLGLELTQIYLNGIPYSFTTSEYEEVGESRTGQTAKRAARGAAIGALIGAIAGGGKGGCYRRQCRRRRSDGRSGDDERRKAECAFGNEAGIYAEDAAGYPGEVEGCHPQRHSDRWPLCLCG